MTRSSMRSLWQLSFLFLKILCSQYEWLDTVDGHDKQTSIEYITTPPDSLAEA